MKTYHNDELKAGGCSALSKNNKKPSETCRVEISKHILTQISGCKSGVYRDCVDTIYNNVAAYIATNSTKKGNAGMPLPAKCYTTAHENDEDCVEGGDEAEVVFPTLKETLTSIETKPPTNKNQKTFSNCRQFT